MKKTVTLIIGLLIAIGTQVTNTKAVSESYEQTFIITAYYSPLPGQRYYVRGGTLEAEKTLQGGGIQGASGKKVFPGMLAAPSYIPYGTVIELDGVGVGLVEDRGGAIVAAGKRGFAHPRLDIWMGHGDEGLLRALAWGKREVKAKVHPPNSIIATPYIRLPEPGPLTYLRAETFYRAGRSIRTFVSKFPEYINKLANLGFEDSKEDVLAFQLQHNVINSDMTKGAGNLGPATRAKIDELYKLIEITTPAEGLKKEALGDEVRKLQKILVDTGYLNYKVTGYFGEKTQEALTKFQITQGILENENNKAAGYIGPETRKILKQIVINDFRKSESIFAENGTILPKLEIIFTSFTTEETENVTAGISAKQYSYNRTLTTGNKGEDVKELQKFLKQQGFLTAEPNGVFGPLTKDAVENFQIAHGINAGRAAGIFGPQSRKIVEQYTSQNMITGYIKEI